jgi:hypothetical protein
MKLAYRACTSAERAAVAIGATLDVESAVAALAAVGRPERLPGNGSDVHGRSVQPTRSAWLLIHSAVPWAWR